MVIKVWYYPTQSQLAVQPSQISQSYVGYETGCGWNTTSSSQGAFGSGGTCTLTPVYNNNLGTVAVVAGQPAITFTPYVSGSYMVCVSGELTTPQVSGSVTSGQLFLVDQSSNVIDRLAARNSDSNASNAQEFPTKMCGITNVTGGSSQQITVQGSSSTGSGGGTSYANIQGITWSIVNLTQNLPAPILVGSVTSNTTGQERIERAIITGGSLSTQCTSDPCTVSKQSGSWITAANWTTTGSYALHIATGEFSDIPTCTVTPDVNDDSAGYCTVTDSAVTTTLVPIKCSLNNYATLANALLNVICMGPH